MNRMLIFLSKTKYSFFLPVLSALTSKTPQGIQEMEAIMFLWCSDSWSAGYTWEYILVAKEYSPINNVQKQFNN